MPPGGLLNMHRVHREDAALTIPGPACITCREKCRKCDRTKPVCQRCITKGLECKGYPDKFRFTGLATRGKWKNRAIPTVSRDHAVRTQPGPGTDQQHLSASPSCEDRSIEPLPIHDRLFSQSEGRAVQLDDLLLLERTELLLAHYDQVICPHQIALPAGADNPYQVYILPLAYEQIGLLYAVLGLTACHMGIEKQDAYLRETLAVEYRVRAIRCLGETLRNGISGELDENERDGIFVIIQILLLQDIFESGISTHGVHITGALSICNQLRLSDTLSRENERTIFFLGNLAWQVLSSHFQFLLFLTHMHPIRLDIIRSLADPQRLCFSPELRAAVSTLSDLKFERVNGCPREIFLIIGNVMEHAKAHATGKMETAEYERLLNACRYELYSWSLKPDRYPNDDPRWPAVAETFRHACILHTSRLLDMTQSAEAPIIQNSVTAILDSLAEIPADCRLIELVVMPIFMAGADALSPYARHYVLLRFDHIKSHGGVTSEMSVSLLKSVWDARGRQAKHDSSNIPWVWFTRHSGSERQHDYLII
ncbi:unnamed protein product [Penicillium egyptiacum]|uniref:Zn(2)-C6 fungal-type domain-containing protein n=1 Tax=Penicillium egyptiacum TaxID=1303716 RepID=A0A9W4KFS3_9EURO|nr:unnamed protein product [Penicillium egyptiacum]